MDGNDGEGWVDFFERRWTGLLRRIREDDPNITELAEDQIDDVEDMTDEDWEQLGRDIANNTHLEHIFLCNGVLNDHKILFLFGGLKRSCSIEYIHLADNGLSAAAIPSMVPFLQNANNLKYLDIGGEDAGNNLQSEGFNILFRALRDCPVEQLWCQNCGIESIEIDLEHIPRHLKQLNLHWNNINADGCRGLAKLLQDGDAALTDLSLDGNEIDDDGVEILVNALQSNSRLRRLGLEGNDSISKQGKIMLLKLVNDISSIETTLQSNHILDNISFETSYYHTDAQIRQHINMALAINRLPEESARKKVIETQLNSVRRSELVELQRSVNQSIYSEIDPLHLPEVLALVGNHHGQGELFVALRSSIAGVISTVNKRQFLEQERLHFRAKIAEYTNKLEAVEAEIATIEASKDHRLMDSRSESQSNKRRRK